MSNKLLVSRSAQAQWAPPPVKYRGRNILRFYISVRYFRSLNVGIENDDICRLVDVKTYTGRECPELRSDAFLVP